MKIGFIGAGNMGGAIIGGMVSDGIAEASDIIVTDLCKTRVNELVRQYNIKQGLSNAAVAAAADMLFLCVKPNVVYTVIDEIKDSVKDDAIIVSIVAGQSIKRLESGFGRRVKLVRVMPNTPALVGAGMAAVVPNTYADSADTEKVLEI